MDPNQQPAPGNQFDFIMKDGGKPTKPSMLPKDKKGKVILGVVGGLLAAMILVVVLSLAQGGQSEPTAILKVAAAQQELINISTDALKRGNDGTVKAIAATTNSVVSSDKALIVKKIPDQKKYNDKYIASLVSKDSQKALDSAASRGAYDKEFMELMPVLLANYQTKLKIAAQEAGVSTKQLLQTAYNNVEALRSSDALETAESQQ